MQLGTRSSTHLIHPVRQRRLWPRPSSSHASRIHEIVTPLSTGYTCPVTIRASLPRRARGTSSYAESQVRNRLSAGGRWIRTLGPPSEGQRFSRLLFPNMRARHRRLRKRSPPRPAAASSSCRSRSDERRTHSPTRRSSGPPDRRHHNPFALITALCFFRVRFISSSCAVALSRGRAPP